MNSEKNQTIQINYLVPQKYSQVISSTPAIPALGRRRQDGQLGQHSEVEIKEIKTRRKQIISWKAKHGRRKAPDEGEERIV